MGGQFPPQIIPQAPTILLDDLDDICDYCLSVKSNVNVIVILQETKMIKLLLY